MKYRKILLCCLSVFLILFLACSVTAHAGKTDSNGGHTDHSSGDYHYHHGYPAHDHYDMDGDGTKDCPYDFDDKTGENSGTTDNQTTATNNSSYKNNNYDDSYTDTSSYSTTKRVQQEDFVYVDSLRITLSFAGVLFITGIFLSFITFQNDALRRWIKVLVSIVVFFICLISFASSLVLTESVFDDYLSTPAYLITSVIVGLIIVLVLIFDLYDKIIKLNAFLGRCLFHAGILYILFFAVGVLLAATIITVLLSVGFFLYMILQAIVESLVDSFKRLRTKKRLKYASNLLASIENSSFPSCASDILYELKKQIIGNPKKFRKPFEPAIQSALYAIVSKRLECKYKTISESKTSPVILQLLLIHYRLHNILKKKNCTVIHIAESTTPDYDNITNSHPIPVTHQIKKKRSLPYSKKFHLIYGIIVTSISLPYSIYLVILNGSVGGAAIFLTIFATIIFSLPAFLLLGVCTLYSDEGTIQYFLFGTLVTIFVYGLPLSAGLEFLINSLLALLGVNFILEELSLFPIAAIIIIVLAIWLWKTAQKLKYIPFIKFTKRFIGKNRDKTLPSCVFFLIDEIKYKVDTKSKWILCADQQEGKLSLLSEIIDERIKLWEDSKIYDPWKSPNRRGHIPTDPEFKQLCHFKKALLFDLYTNNYISEADYKSEFSKLTK